ncbi:MAG: cache domain-containing protein [Nitrospiraceae bacterium]
MSPIHDPRTQISLYVWLPVSIVAIVMVAAASGMVVLRSVNQRLMERTGESLVVSAGGLAESLNRLLSEQARQAQSMAETPVLRGQDMEQAMQHLRRLQRTSPSYVSIGLADADGRVVAGSYETDVGSDESRSAWFQSLRQGNGIQVSEVETERGRAVLMAAAMKNDEGAWLGAVLIRIGLQSFTRVWDDALRRGHRLRQAGAGLEYRLVGSDGTLFFDSSVREIGRTNLKHLGMPSAVLSTLGRSGYVEETHFRRQVPVVTGYAPVSGDGTFPALRWGLTVSMDRSGTLASIQKDFREVVVWGGIGSLMLAALLIWVVASLIRAWIRAKAREAWLTSLVQSINRGVIVTDTHDRVIFLNQAAEALTGWKEKDAQGKALPAVFAVLEESAFSDNRDSGTIARGGRGRLKTPDRTERKIAYSVAPMNGGRGTASGSVILCEEDRICDSGQTSATDLGSEEAITHDRGGGHPQCVDDPRLWKTLQHWTRAAGVHRVCLFETHQGEDGTVWASRRYEWISQGSIARTEWSQWFSWSMRAKGFSRWKDTLSAGQIIDGQVGRFPEVEQTALLSCGIHTLVAAPLFVHGSWWGFVEFDHCLTQREWTKREVDGLTTAARTVGAVLQNAHDEAGLQRLLAALNTTLESTADGLLVVDDQGHLISVNQRLLAMWHLPDAAAEFRTIDHILGLMMEQLTVPDALLRTISELSNQPDTDSYDILDLKDGRKIERVSCPKREGSQIVGRVWTFHEVMDGGSPIQTGDELPVRDRGNSRSAEVGETDVRHR